MAINQDTISRFEQFTEETLGIESELKQRRKGFDLFLENQFGQNGSFYTALFDAIRVADDINLVRLHKGFPFETLAYVTYTYVSGLAFLAKCTPDHALLDKMRLDL